MERDCESELSKLNIEQNACIYHFGASVIHGQRSNILRLQHMIRSGINIAGKKHGPHSLRASLASSMVNDGISYETVRKVLGHDSPNAIRHYARLDIQMLRNCALACPAPSGTLHQFLKGGRI